MAILGIPLVNGVAYTHADIIVPVFGVPLIGITAIDYSRLQEITGNHSTGHEVTSVGFGVVTNSATLTVTMEAFNALVAAAPNGDIQNIPFFNVPVTYAPEIGITRTDVLTKCRFKGPSVDSSVGNSQIEVSLELFVAKIKMGV